jgi:hypothetical protein
MTPARLSPCRAPIRLARVPAGAARQSTSPNIAAGRAARFTAAPDG